MHPPIHPSIQETVTCGCSQPLPKPEAKPFPSFLSSLLSLTSPDPSQVLCLGAVGTSLLIVLDLGPRVWSTDLGGPSLLKCQVSVTWRCRVSEQASSVGSDLGVFQPPQLLTVSSFFISTCCLLVASLASEMCSLLKDLRAFLHRCALLCGSPAGLPPLYLTLSWPSTWTPPSQSRLTTCWLLLTLFFYFISLLSRG